MKSTKYTCDVIDTRTGENIRQREYVGNLCKATKFFKNLWAIKYRSKNYKAVITLAPIELPMTNLENDTYCPPEGINNNEPGDKQHD